VLEKEKVGKNKQANNINGSGREEMWLSDESPLRIAEELFL